MRCQLCGHNLDKTVKNHFFYLFQINLKAKGYTGIGEGQWQIQTFVEAMLITSLVTARSGDSAVSCHTVLWLAYTLKAI